MALCCLGVGAGGRKVVMLIIAARAADLPLRVLVRIFANLSHYQHLHLQGMGHSSRPKMLTPSCSWIDLCVACSLTVVHDSRVSSQAHHM